MADQKLRYKVTADTKQFTTAMTAVGVLVVAALSAAVKITAKFNKELSKLRAVSGASNKEMVLLEKNARNLGKSTAFTALEVASLQVELAKLGFVTNDILNASGGVLALAAGLGSTLADAAVLTGSTLRAFGLDSSKTGEVVDILAKAASESALDIEKLRESLKLAAPIARASNFSLAQTAGILEVLANNGIHGSMAGTGLAKVFVTVAKTGKPLNVLLQEIRDSENGLATATEIFGLRANKVALIMANNLTPAVRDFNGYAKQQQDIMEDNLIGDYDKLKSAVDNLGITMGKTTTGPMRDMTQGLTELLNGSKDVVPLFDQIDFAFNVIAQQAYRATLAIYEYTKAFKDLVKLDSTGLDSTIRLLKQSIILSEGLNRSIDKARVERANPTKTKPTTGNVPTSGGSTGGNPAGGGKDFTAQFGLLAFSESGFFDGALKNVEGFTTKVESAFTKMAGGIKDQIEKVGKDTIDLGQLLQDQAGAIGSGIASAISAGVSGEQSFGEAFLGLVGGFLVQLGTLMISAGVALLLFEAGLASLNPFQAIAAGAALVVAGALVSKTAKGGLSGSAGGGGGGGARSAPSSVDPAFQRLATSSGDSSNRVGGIRGNEFQYFDQVSRNRRNKDT